MRVNSENESWVLTPSPGQSAHAQRLTRAWDPFWLEPGATWGVTPRHMWVSPGAAAAQTRPYGSAGLGAHPGWAVQRRSRVRPGHEGPEEQNIIRLPFNSVGCAIF